MDSDNTNRKATLAFFVVFMAFTLVFSSLTTFAATAPAIQPTPSWVQVSESPITAGAVLDKYIWTAMRGKNQVQSRVSVISVDLQNPLVSLEPMSGTNGQFTKNQSVRGMAGDTGAVAGINGDFFNTQAEGVPLGAEITQQVVMSSPELNTPGFYNFAVTQDNKPIIDTFTFQGRVAAADGAIFPLDGVNKSYYWYETPVVRHAMDNSMFVYTNAWGSSVRAVDRNTDLVEVLVENGVIKQIAKGSLPIVAPKDGYILRTEGAAEKFVYAHMKVGDPIHMEYQIVSQSPSAQYDPSTFKMLIGGGSILVDGGKAAAFSRNPSSVAGYRSRTGIGYSQDRRYAYLITVESSSDSSGASLSEFQKIMIAAGVWKGMNLDGGGSTQMVARPLGETDVDIVNQVENGSERSVANGLGVYSLAPAGKLSGLTVQGPAALFLHEQGTYNIKAYDQYDNPVAPPTNMTWTDDNESGTFAGNVLTPTVTGTAQIRAHVGLVNEVMSVDVIGAADIASLTLIPSVPYLTEGASIGLQLKVKTKSGITRTISAAGFPLEISGFTGNVTDDGVLHVANLNGSTMGQIVVHYDGYSSMLTMPLGVNQLWADFDKLDYPVVFSQYPFLDVTGSVTKLNQMMQLKYNFSSATSATKAAYANFGDPAKGAAVLGSPQTMQLRVNGDNSLNMLRAEFIDADGDHNVVTLAQSINWSGWQTVSADLSSLNLTYPVTLQRIYVVSPQVGQDERAKSGEVDLDDISFEYEQPLPQLARNQIQLTIGQKTVLVNGTEATVLQPPVIVNNNTLVPIRFVAEQLGGAVNWDPLTKLVSIKRGNQLVDFHIGSNNYFVNGVSAALLTAPQIMSSSTMIPLRVLSENLGWTVNWDALTQSVTLQ